MARGRGDGGTGRRLEACVGNGERRTANGEEMTRMREREKTETDRKRVDRLSARKDVRFPEIWTLTAGARVGRRLFYWANPITPR